MTLSARCGYSGLVRRSVQMGFLRSLATAARAYTAQESAPVHLDDGSILYPSQALYLMTLRAMPGTGLTGIASTLFVSKPSASQALSRLEELGFVKRDSAPDDGRGILFRLTPAGTHACQTLTRRHNAAINRLRKVTSGYKQTELKRFGDLLDAMSILFGGDRPVTKRGPRHS